MMNHWLRRMTAGFRASAWGALTGLAAFGAAGTSLAGELPVPCVVCATGSGTTGWVSSGVATLTSDASHMTINAGTLQKPDAILNWQSFNIGAGNSVRFVQPNSTAIALNNIYQADPSRIFGALSANGTIYLINQNGIVFGNPDGSPMQVNVHGLIASTLGISQNAIANGILSPIQTKNAAFLGGGSGVIQVNAGAQLRTDDGGRIALFAPTVQNAGHIETPNGQTVLAAGGKVYLQASDDPNLRGLLVEVDNGGTVTNSGSILATEGNISLLGLAINQQGRITATTSVSKAGSVSLLARDSVSFFGSRRITAIGANAGAVEFGAGSVTEVALDTSGATAVDDQPQPVSKIDVDGKTIHLAGGSTVHAAGGQISLIAEIDPTKRAADVITTQPRNDAAMILMDAGSRVDAAGEDVDVAMARNQVTVQLRGNELADSPLQRNGILRGATVTVDVRADGGNGTPLGNASGYLRTIQRGVAERLGQGGSVSVSSDGSVDFARDAVIDVSGGAVNYQAGYIATTKLVSNGKVYDIGSAPANITYDAIIGGGSTSTDPKWGITQSYVGLAAATYQPGYVNGRSAGSVQIAGRELQLGGDILAQTRSGAFQRDPSLAPLGGLLTIGLPGGTSGNGLVDLIAPSITLGTVSDPAQATTQDYLSMPKTIANGVSRIAVYSDGRISLAPGADVELPAGGQLSLTGAAVDIGASVHAPGGRISARDVELDPATRLDSSPGLSIADGTVLDVSGQWINDFVALDPSAPLYINGGQIKLVSAALSSSLNIGAGVLLDAQGGARVGSNSAITGGYGGDITIAASELGSTLKIGAGTTARGFAVGRGGTLSLTAPAVDIVTDAARPGFDLDLGQQQASTNTTPFVLDASAFRRGGFSRYSITANQGDLRVANGASIQAATVTRVLRSNALAAPSGSGLDNVSDLGYLPDYLAAPVNLNLALSLVDAQQRPGQLRVETGAQIATGPLGSIALNTSGGAMYIDGILRAPGGTISATALSSGAFDPSFSLWVGPHTLLDASGSVQLTPASDGGNQVLPLGGGSVALTSSGYLITAQGSRIVARGASALVDVVKGGDADQWRDTPGANDTLVGSSGGAIALTGGEGIIADGSLDAAAGAPGYFGGNLSLTMSHNAYRPSNSGGQYPNTLSQVSVVQHTSGLPPTDVAFGTALDSNTFDGRAAVTVDSFAAGGFDSVSLSADDQIVFGGGGLLDLQLGRALQLNAPVIRTASATNVNIAAPSVTIGSRFQSSAAAAPDGAATLKIDAANIDMVGATTLSGFDDVSIHSDGDIRLRGFNGVGGLTTVGSLLVQANRIYPASMTAYTVTVGDTASGTPGSIDVKRNSTPVNPSDGLQSVGGSLIMKAATIAQNGVLEAPLGSISLLARDSLKLADGSLTSVHLSSNSVLLGSTVNLTDWYYSYAGSGSFLNGDQLYGATAQKFPSKGIRLDGKQLSVDAGAVVDLSGGGDVLAYEQIPGPNGSKDALSIANAGSMFAVVPLDGSFGPVDPAEFAQWQFAPGTAITLAQGAYGLPAGTYAILPARYGLLPGAYLVTPASGYPLLNGAHSINLADGGVVVPGFLTQLGTNLRGGNASGYVIHPAGYANSLAEYHLTSANTYLPLRAAQLALSATRTPIDAGALALAGQGSLRLDGTFHSDAAAGGLGSLVDITADFIAVVNTLDSSAGVTEVLATDLEHLGTSVLLGGTRQPGAGGTTIVAAADSVTIGDGVTIALPELMLAASDTIHVGANAQLKATGGAAGAAGGTFVFKGDGALAVVSQTKGLSLDRSYAPGSIAGQSGVVTIDPGASLAAGGSIIVDGSRDFELNGSLAPAIGSTVSLGSSAIRLGDGGTASGGLQLGSASLAQFANVDLTLKSASSISLLSPVSLQTRNLALDAGSITGELSDGGAVAVLAANDTLTLRNSSGTSAAPGAATVGELDLNAGKLVMGSGTSNLYGFSKVAMTAQQLIAGKGQAVLDFQGDLQATAPLVTLTDGSRLRLVSSDGTGAVQFASTGGAPADNAFLGGVLEVDARRIEQDGNLLLHSGLIELNAADGVQFGTTSRTIVRGLKVSLGGNDVYAAGGGIDARAGRGSVDVAGGATLDVSAASAGGDAGALRLSATQGAVNIDTAAIVAGQGASAGGHGADFHLSAGSLGVLDFTSLNAALNQGGFNGARSFHFTGAQTPTVTLAAGGTIAARDVQLIVDQGGVDIEGSIRANNPTGTAAVSIAARDDVRVGAGGLIAVHGGGTATTAARIDLASRGGGVLVDAGAALQLNAPNATGSGGGAMFRYQLSRDALAAGGLSIAGSVSGAAAQRVVGVQSYDVPAGSIDTQTLASASNPIYADAQSFMDSTAANTLRAEGYTVRPGVELRTSGDLQINSGWDLSKWRFDGAPVDLTIRAGRSITVNASLSDGFNGVDAAASLRNDASGDLRLTAGADLGSVDAGAVKYGGQGDLVIAPDTRMRTGTGDLALAAAGNVALSGSVSLDDPYAQSVVYTAGRSAGLELDHLTNSPQPSKYLPVDGGSLSVGAGRDIVGAPSDFEAQQLFVEWYLRQPATASEQAGMWINYGNFQQNFAAFGGGNLALRAGGNVTRVGAVVPTTAAYDPVAGLTHYYGQGSLDVRAGGDVASGQFFVGRGTGTITADGSLTATNQGPYGAEPVGTVLAAMQTKFTVAARGDITLGTVVNPTLIGQVNQDGQQTDYFLSYSPDASVRLNSTAGSIHMQNSGGQVLATDLNQSQLSQYSLDDLQIFPGTVSATALRGDIELGGNLDLAPSPLGNLSLLAQGNLTAHGETSISDLNPLLLPSLERPDLRTVPIFLQLLESGGNTGSAAHSNPPLHSAAASSRLVAATGDIAGGFWLISEPADIYAGQDIRDLRFNLQNLDPQQISQVIAGRDISFGSNNINYGINLAGPGQLVVAAGRNIDLGASYGIVSEGNLVNAGLPGGGADITVLAGIADRVSDSSVPDKPTLDQFFKALRDAGRKAVAGGGDFSDGYAAIAKLFPEVVGQTGNLSMIQSRIYTLDGGDIDLAVPHGAVNVGVAQASASSVTKTAAQLGIVAEKSGSVRAFSNGDFLVNSSRVFTLGGGDILIWSSNGNIDAGRGAKTTVSAPPPTLSIDAQGNIVQNFGAAIAGSGIRGILAQPGLTPGDVDLYAPRGFVVAGDAGIGSAGNITIGAIQVIGADNINFGGSAVGVPVDTSGLGASLSGASSASSSAGSSAGEAAGNAGGGQDKSPLADSALSWLDVFVLGLGEETCKQDDLDCLKRQAQRP